MTAPEAFHVHSGSTALIGERWPGEGGAAAPTVVLLHSGVTDRRSWTEVASALAGATVLAYDRRGYGDTGPAEEEYTHLADLLAVLDHEVDGPAWLVGNSAGGALALDLTLTAPELVAGLVLISPSISGSPEMEYDRATTALGEQLEAAEHDGDLDEVNRLETWIWLDGPTSREGRVSGPPRDLLLEMNGLALRNDAEFGEFDGRSGLPAWDRLAEIEVPVLVVCGDLDVPGYLYRSRIVAERVRRGRFVALTGRGHLPALEDPGEIADLIRTAMG